MAKKAKPLPIWHPYASQIASKIRAELNKKDLWIYDLANILELKPAGVSSIMTGKRNLTLKTIIELEQALDITLFGSFPDGFKDHIQDSIITVSGNIKNFEFQILEAVKQRNELALETPTTELAKQEAVKQFIDDLITQFPELAG